MPSPQDRIEDPFILSHDMSSQFTNEPTSQKRKMSHCDRLDDGTPPTHTDTNPNLSPTNTKDEKVAYNGPTTIYVVMLRVSTESSARPMPQAAFFGRDRALAFSTRILLQWCDAHYGDYVWKGAEVLRAGLVERYAAYDAQSGQQLAVADVIRVSVFDAKETEVVVKREETEEDEGSEETEGKLDQAHIEEHREQLGDGPQGGSDDTEMNSTHSARIEEQEVDLVASGEYAMELVTRTAKHDERDAFGRSKRRSAWSEDHEMKVFGGPTE
ncbi:hypothetical protein E4T48_08311 [Aureobasidium sp. EXF-10727]|nr:hypothetical protein E4T48_08311 [Aureobasidium sp. EXF-10727]